MAVGSGTMNRRPSSSTTCCLTISNIVCKGLPLLDAAAFARRSMTRCRARWVACLASHVSSSVAAVSTRALPDASIALFSDCHAPAKPLAAVVRTTSDSLSAPSISTAKRAAIFFGVGETCISRSVTPCGPTRSMWSAAGGGGAAEDAWAGPLSSLAHQISVPTPRRRPLLFVA